MKKNKKTKINLINMEGAETVAAFLFVVFAYAVVVDMKEKRRLEVEVIKRIAYHLLVWHTQSAQSTSTNYPAVFQGCTEASNPKKGLVSVSFKFQKLLLLGCS